MHPTRTLPVIALASLLTVEVGGWALLGFLTGHGRLSAFQEQFFRAGHAHAGVLLVLSLVYFLYLEKTSLPTTRQWAAGALLLTGILAQSGGFFLHLAVGEEGSSSAGTWLTRAGAVGIAVALVLLLLGLATSARVSSAHTGSTS
jgi:heme/copper-type cytochrome/quinol oxidase subunit 4